MHTIFSAKYLHAQSPHARGRLLVWGTGRATLGVDQLNIGLLFASAGVRIEPGQNVDDAFNAQIAWPRRFPQLLIPFFCRVRFFLVLL